MYSLGLFVQLYCGMFIDQYAKKRNQSVDVIRTKWYHPQMVPPTDGSAHRWFRPIMDPLKITPPKKPVYKKVVHRLSTLEKMVSYFSKSFIGPWISNPFRFLKVYNTVYF